MLPRSQPGMSRMQEYCWCSESDRRHSQEWRSGLQWEAKGESRFQQRCLESSCIEHFSTRSSKTRYTRSVRWPDHYGHEWLAMKLLPMRFRETQTQCFDKRGISWHFSAVVHKSNHTDYLVVSISERTIHTCGCHLRLQTGLVFRFLYTWRGPCLCQRTALISM